MCLHPWLSLNFWAWGSTDTTVFLMSLLLLVAETNYRVLFTFFLFSLKTYLVKKDKKSHLKISNHSLTHSAQYVWLAIFNFFLHSLQIWQVSLRYSTALNHLWWWLTNTYLDNHNFYFLPLSSPKSVEYTVHFNSHVQTNAVCYTWTLNSGFPVSIPRHTF